MRLWNTATQRLTTRRHSLICTDANPISFLLKWQWSRSRSSLISSGFSQMWQWCDMMWQWQWCDNDNDCRKCDKCTIITVPLVLMESWIWDCQKIGKIILKSVSFLLWAILRFSDIGWDHRNIEGNKKRNLFHATYTGLLRKLTDLGSTHSTVQGNSPIRHTPRREPAPCS